ncbi:MAG: helix-turn-helix domain-containing protein [Nocardioides sp.]|uniref:IclR family transcriptional regulator n=1 Tax=Nocardioides sp. TaxID=35761 RepID=UPI0039E4F0C7
MESAPPTGDGSQTLERGLAVLVELSRHADGLTTAQLAQACSLHRSITNRLLVSLQRTGFAERDSAGIYTVGPTAATILRNSRPQLREIAFPVLRRLARRVDATASLVEVIEAHAVTTLIAEPQTQGPRFTYRLGNRDPLDQGAGGIAALASGPAQAGEPARVADARASGLVITHGELNPGAYGVAAPLPGWGTRAAINIVTNRPEVAALAESVIGAAAAEIVALAPDLSP